MPRSERGNLHESRHKAASISNQAEASFGVSAPLRMKVLITEIVAGESDRPRVKFICHAGEAWAIWRGRVAPGPADYDVELNFNKKLTRAAIVGLVAGRATVLAVQGEIVWVDCYLDSVDDDGMAFLRLNSGLVMIESDLIPSDARSAVSFSLRADEIEMFPTGFRPNQTVRSDPSNRGV